MKPVVRRAAADRDVEEIVDYYLSEGGPALALRFIDSLEQGFGHLSRQPGSGSPHYGHELSLRALRSWPLRSFPYLVLYFELPASVEIWRVLHGRREIPVHLQPPE